SSIGEDSPTTARHASSTCTWQVAQAHAPPHSASMPGMLFLIAVSITVEPISPSTVRAAPSRSIYVIFGMRGRAREKRGVYSGSRETALASLLASYTQSEA